MCAGGWELGEGKGGEVRSDVDVGSAGGRRAICLLVDRWRSTFDWQMFYVNDADARRDRHTQTSFTVYAGQK